MNSIGRDWLCAQEIVNLGFCSRTNEVSRAAKNNNWERRRREGRGGGYEYHLSSLPTEYQFKILNSQTNHDKIRKVERGQRLLGQLNDLPEKYRGIALAKFHVVKCFVEWLCQNGNGDQFIESFNCSEICLENSVRNYVDYISRRSLYRWRKAVEDEDVETLANIKRKRNAGKKSTIDSQPELRDYILSLVFNKPHLSAANIHRSARGKFRNEPTIQIPHVRNLRIWLEKWKEENRSTYTMLTNPDAFRGVFGVAFGSLSDDVDRINQRWELDSTPADLLLATGNRYQLVGVIDVRSRRFMMRVVEQSNSMEIAALVRRAVIDWGVPENVKLDNGSDYTSNHMQDVFRTLNVGVSLCPPYSPEMKPHIERVFRTFSHSIVELLPHFVGHNVAERFDLEMQKAFSDRLNKRSKFDKNLIEMTGITPQELQKICDEWCELMYMNEQHQSLGCSPNEFLAASKDPVSKIRDERVLDMLLLKAPGSRNGHYVVQKKGIRIDKRWHISTDLVSYIGQEVQVLYDPVDLGTIVVRHPETHKFLCTAYAPEIVGIDRQEVAIRAKQKQRAAYSAIKKDAARLKRQYKPEDAYREVLDDMRERRGMVMPFPQPEKEYSTPALESMSAAADALDASTNIQIEKLEAEIIENVAFDKTEEQTFENPAIKFRQLIFDSYERSLSKEELEWIDLAREKSWITERWIDICLLEAEAEFDCETPVLHALN